MVESHCKASGPDMFDAIDATSDVLAWVDRIIRQIENEKTWKPGGQSTPVGEAAITNVNTAAVTHENTSEQGPVLAGVHAWNELGMNEILRSCGLPDTRIHAALVGVVNRLVDPVAENGLLDWYRSTALGDIMVENLQGAGDERFYRASDSLLKHSEAIESALRKRTLELHKPDRTILLYDLADTHFEGECLQNPKAKRGKNKQGRSDCPQVVVGRIFDINGFELGHHIFAGNQADSTSVPTMLSKMTEICGDCGEGSSRVLVVMGSGMSSEANLASIRKSGYSYLVNDRRPLRCRYKEEFADKESFTKIEERDGRIPVLVRHLSANTVDDSGENIPEQILMCMSDERGKKEKAILSTAEK